MHQYSYGVGIKHIKIGKYSSLIRDSHWVTDQDVQVVTGEERTVRVPIIIGYSRKGHSIPLN